MLLDANVLLYAVHRESRYHDAAKAWLTEQLNGSRRIGFPWQSLGAFLRIATHPRAFERPLAPAEAWSRVTEWLASGVAWVPAPGPRHADLLSGLITKYDVRGNLVPDALLTALALEHGLSVVSADTDFARFTEVRWDNPFA